MTRVKICGITNLEDALHAVDSGADALGFNFYRKSPRYIEPYVAREIIKRLPDRVLRVGIFVRERVEAVINVERTAGINAIQLHGREEPDYVSVLLGQTNAEVIRAFHVNGSTIPIEIDMFQGISVLLDTERPGQEGGTGRTFDWKSAADGQRFKKLYLAGGLNPGNVRSAVQMVRPDYVDVASGVEASPRKKDPKKIEAFIKEAKQA